MKWKKLTIYAFSALLFLCIYVNFHYDLYFQRNGAFHSFPFKLRGGNYLVNTLYCTIKDENPFDPAIASELQQPKLQLCGEPMVNVTNKTLTLNEGHPMFHTASCCYREIHRVTVRNFSTWTEPDWSNQYSECQPISKTNGARMTSEFVKIECSYVENGVRGTWTDFFAIAFPPLQHSEASAEKYKFWKNQSTLKSIPKPPSVLLIGIDSVSRLHMMRYLPETRRFLKANDFVEMKGYTKVGENTFPNMMASLGGMTAGNYPCWMSRFDALDNCPLIWKNFSEHKYVTAFIEETASFGSLNFLKTGFVEQPTDYYLRPITAAYHGALDVEHAYRGCVGGMNQTDFILKYTREVIEAINHDAPYFIHFWLTTLAHDDFNAHLQFADLSFKQNLEKFVGTEGNDTVIIFISDHGYRYGTYRQSLNGYHEESLPFSFIRLPPSLKKRFPHWYTNLQRNSAQLTSPLDLHATLEDILSLTRDSLQFSYTHNNWQPQFRSVYSFFEKTPLNRSCESSGILLQHCRCDSFSKEPVDWGYFQTVVSQTLVDQINEFMREPILNGTCAELAFKKFIYVRRFEKTGLAMMSDFGKDYVVGFEVAPSGARFEARCTVRTDGTFQTFGYFNRVNSYENGSKCVTDPNIRRYCYCL